MENKLPDTPHEVLRAVMEDFKAIIKSKDYIMDMRVWMLKPVSSNRCRVCLGGAVMAETFKVPRATSTLPWSTPDGASPFDARDAGFFSERDCDLIVALDSVRQGRWRQFLKPFFPVDGVDEKDLCFSRDHRGQVTEKHLDLYLKMQRKFSTPPSPESDLDGFVWYFETAADFMEEWWQENMV